MEYLKELYYDPMVFTSEGLRHLIAPERLSPGAAGFASTELISGCGAPFFTDKPMGTRASTVVVPPTSLAARTSFSARGLVQGTGDFPGIAITLDLFNWAHGQHARCRHGARQRVGGVLSETNSPSTSYKPLRRAI